MWGRGCWCAHWLLFPSVTFQNRMGGLPVSYLLAMLAPETCDCFCVFTTHPRGHSSGLGVQGM